jgi:nucleoside-diphosphate-sugar epimerase
MKVLVTGGTGFIGAYVTKSLVQQGHQVVCYDLMPDGNSLDKVLGDKMKSEVTILRGDVTDPVGFFRAAGESHAEVVIHLASLLAPASDANPRLALKVNCGSLLDIFEIAKTLGIKRVVWASSIAVFGDRSRYADKPLSDSAVHFPMQVYGATKSLNEFMAQYYFKNFGLDNIGLRYTIVYGYARMRGASAFASELLVKPALGQPGVVPYADACLDWQYVEDAATVTVMAALREGSTETRVFNTGGILGTGREVAKIVQKLIPDAKLTLQPGTMMGMEFPRYDVSGAAVELGFRPQYDLRTGVFRTINDIRREAGLSSIQAPSYG